ncbi:hypothetical protein N7508_002503 [Penicillium antarcticum]|uniref:uncharacterized protein n=1 Tax=Penicillium antarcticum TaxID=416450 RepID=UPI00238CDF90|nr:uncharacterized protein N7508_002503 [Penicillium antarcticum]KAJ5317995.1 hypothetical protein N7508_002503 [Penicillium antarcticum]
MAGHIICCPDIQLSYAKNPNIAELDHFVLWARKTTQSLEFPRTRRNILPKGVFEAKHYFQITHRPSLDAHVPSTRTFIPRSNDNTPYQEVLSTVYIEKGYRGTGLSSRCGKHNKYIELSLYERHLPPTIQKYLTPQSQAEIRRGAVTQERPTSPLRKGDYCPLSAIEDNKNNLEPLNTSTLPPYRKEPSPPSLAEKKDRHRRQRNDSLPPKQTNTLLISPVKPPFHEIPSFRRCSREGFEAISKPSSSTEKQVDNPRPLEIPTWRSPAEENKPSFFAQKKHNHREQSKASTSPSRERKAAPFSTVAEKTEDLTWRAKPTASQPSGKRPSPSSIVPEKECVCPARSEIAAIRPGIIEDAIKRLKIAKAQPAHSSLVADAVVVRAVVAGVASSDDIFYMPPPEQPEPPTESENEDVCKLEAEDFGYCYPGRVFHNYTQYDDDEWVNVTAYKDWEVRENYAWEI